MHIQFVTYRWGADLIGGAELHHRRLALELVEAGHRVSVLTTTGHGFRPFCHWGVIWDSYNAESGDDEGIQVERFPLKPTFRWQLAWEAKSLQARYEDITTRPDAALDTLLLDAAGSAPGVQLLDGFHHPEVHGGALSRWTMKKFRLLVAGEGTLRLWGNAPRANRWTASVGGEEIGSGDLAKGWFEIKLPLAGGGPHLVTIELGATWHPVADFRGLGVMIEGAETSDGHVADLAADYRSLGRRRPEPWQEHLLARAAKFTGYTRSIDRLRGPRSYRLRRAIDDSTADVVIHCNMPWANISYVRPGDLVMPLWHIEDEFYYWPHWIAALRRARFVLANTPYTAEGFFPRLGVKAHFVGPPIWPAQGAQDPAAAAAFRKEHGIAPGEALVLTVCRKSGEKGYAAVAESVARLSERGVPVRFIGVGPDQDRRPFNFRAGAWIGPLTDAALQAAYAACDVFALMSESESFGMVIPEAWHHGKPVVVNRHCGPAASLVEEARTGLLATPGAELDAALERLARDKNLRDALGTAGRGEAQSKYTRGAAARRLLEALER